MATIKELVYVLGIFRDVTGHFTSDYIETGLGLVSEDYTYSIRVGEVIDINSFRTETIDISHISGLGYRDGVKHYWKLQIPYSLYSDDCIESFAISFSNYFKF